MYSIINGIQVIKMFGWEKAFEGLINTIRRDEMKAIAKGYYVKATLLSFEILTSLAVFVTLVLYIYTGNSITAEKAFVTIAYFNFVNRHLVYFWPLAVASVADGWISLKRVESFLTQKVSKDDSESIPETTTMEITLKNASAYWNKEDDNRNGITSVNLNVTPQELTAIVGHVGSGKTTLLEVILKELPLIEGSLEIGGSISYAAQLAWIFEGSVRNNIVFIEDFNEIRYKRVIHVCELERDLEQLPSGDETIVGERGISLSGGQKARINLARAIYKKADIYLLDDILSAVDAVVGKNIFEKVIRQFLKVNDLPSSYINSLGFILFSFRKGKTCVLVTHQLQYLHDVKNIFVMEKGKIKVQAYLELSMVNRKAKATESVADARDEREVKSRVKHMSGNLKVMFSCKQADLQKKCNEDGPSKDQKVTKETQQSGQVTSAVYKSYLKAVKSSTIVVSVAFLFIVAQAFHSGSDYFVSIW